MKFTISIDKEEKINVRSFSKYKEHIKVQHPYFESQQTRNESELAWPD